MKNNFNDVLLKTEIDFSSSTILDTIENLSQFWDIPYLQPLLSFTKDWLSGKEVFLFETSGTTGKSKSYLVSRQQIIASIEATRDYFNLKEKDKVFICLNMQYTGGKMMLARAIHLKLKTLVVPPSNHPFSLPLNDTFKLTALIPSQLLTYIKFRADNKIFPRFENIIIGGGKVNELLIRECEKIKDSIFYETFGMTETVSHIALKRLNNGSENSFQTLPGIEIGTNDSCCLKVKGVVTQNQWIESKDVVEIIDSRHFIWKGRIDNLINSGGIKILPEEIEAKIADILFERGIKDFFISSKEDFQLGEKMVLVVEGNMSSQDNLLEELKTYLPKYMSPKEIIFLSNFERTETGKIKRIRLK